jgi:hypothetical protein
MECYPHHNLDNKNPATWWDWGRRGYLKEEVYNPWQPVPHEPPSASRAQGRAGNGTRTRDIHLGKVTLYQLSYSRVTKNITNSQPFCKSFLNPPAVRNASACKILTRYA